MEKCEGAARKSRKSRQEQEDVVKLDAWVSNLKKLAATPPRLMGVVPVPSSYGSLLSKSDLDAGQVSFGNESNGVVVSDRKLFHGA
jgi:hypothetical protein